MPDPVQLIPLAEIDAGRADPRPHRPRPRAAGRARALHRRLRPAPADRGLPPPRAPRRHRYGLISGFRRLLAFRTLHERTGQDRYATIPAFVRERTSLAAALAAMVEENEIRAGLSPFERGLIAVPARNQGAFASIEEAVDGLYPSANRQKRLRLRALAHFAEEMDGQFAAPEKLCERQVDASRGHQRRLRRPDPHRAGGIRA